MNQAIAQAMNRLQNTWDTKANEYAALVLAGTLSPDEAAKCLAGADMKVRAVIEEEYGFRPGPGGNIRVAQQAIDSRLPGYNGLIIGRHV